MATNSTIKTKRRKAAIRGIGKDAKRLGCCREHLRLVLRGKRISPKLMARWHALKTKRGGRNGV